MAFESHWTLKSTLISCQKILWKCLAVPANRSPCSLLGKSDLTHVWDIYIPLCSPSFLQCSWHSAVNVEYQLLVQTPQLLLVHKMTNACWWYSTRRSSVVHTSRELYTVDVFFIWFQTTGSWPTLSDQLLNIATFCWACWASALLKGTAVCTADWIKSTYVQMWVSYHNRYKRHK